FAVCIRFFPEKIMLSNVGSACSGDLPLFALLLAHLFGGGHIAGQELVAKVGVCSGQNSSTQLSGEAQHEMNIVNRAQTVVKLLLCPNKMVDVCRAIIATGIALAALFDGAAHRAETGRLDIDAPGCCEKPTMTCNTRRQNAIEHIHAQSHTD